MIRSRNLLLLLAFVLAISGCEELGLEDDDNSNSTPVEEPEPETNPLEVTEPQVVFPLTKFLYFTGTDQSDPDTETPINFVYSYDVISRGILRQSGGQTARVLPVEIPLGKGRYSRGFKIIEENGIYFRASPSFRTLTQLGTINTGDQTICEEIVRANGLGDNNTRFLLYAAQAGTNCGDVSNSRLEISLDAAVDDVPANVSATQFSVTPLHNQGYDIIGYLQLSGDNELKVLNSDFNLVSSFSPLSTTDFSITRINSEGDLIVVINHAVYLTTANELTSQGSSITPVATLNNITRINDRLWAADSTDLYLLDGNQIRRISFETRDSQELIDLSNLGTVSSYLSQNDSHLFVRFSHGEIHRVEKTTGITQQLLGNSTSEFLVWKDYLYATAEQENATTGYLIKLGADQPTCPPVTGSAPEDTTPVAKSVSIPENSDNTVCTAIYDAKWAFTKENSERGREIHPILMQGFDSDNFDSYSAPYFNNPRFSIFAAELGQERVVLTSNMSGQQQLLEVGWTEQGHGLLSLKQYHELNETYADVYYFNTDDSNTMRNISSSVSIEEKLIDISRNE